MTNELVLNRDLLGPWTKLAVDFKLHPSIFRFCLEVDFHMATETKTKLNYLDNIVRVVAPNFFLGGQLFDINSVEDKESAKSLADRLREAVTNLCKAELFELTELEFANNSKYIYETTDKGGFYSIYLYSTFLRTSFELLLLSHTEKFPLRLVLRDYTPEGSTSHDYETIDEALSFAVNTILDDNMHFTYDTVGEIEKLIQSSNMSMYQVDKVFKHNVPTSVTLGPLTFSSVSSSDSSFETALFFHGRIVEDGMGVLYKPESIKNLNTIINENIDEYRKIRYINILINRINDIEVDSINKEKVLKEIEKRRSMISVMGNAFNSEFKVDEFSKRGHNIIRSQDIKESMKVKIATNESGQTVLTDRPTTYAPLKKVKRKKYGAVIKKSENDIEPVTDIKREAVAVPCNNLAELFEDLD